MRAYRSLYGREPDGRSAFKHARLPDAADYYAKHLGKLRKAGKWSSARCPFHEDTAPSLSINLDHGGFCCHACGAKGGDVLAFHMRLKDLDFVSAAKDLGAWEPSHE